MVWKITGDFLALKLDPGDDLLLSIANACEESGFGSAFVISCIGALRKARFTSVITTSEGFKYAPMRELDGAIELLIASGNCQPKESGGWKVHMHGVFCIEDKEFTGGHLDDTGNIIGVTAEMLLAKFPGMVRQSVQGVAPSLKL